MLNSQDQPSEVVPARKILFVAGALQGGGAENQLFQLANGLARLGHDITVATVLPQTVRGDFCQLVLCGSRTRNRFLNAMMLGYAVWRLRACLLRLQPDTMITWLAVPTLIGAAAVVGKSTPWIAAIRNSQPEKMRSVPAGLLNLPIRAALTRANRVIANSAAGLAGYRRLGLLVHARTAVIANCINTIRFHPPSREQRSAARERLGVRQDVPVVAYVGRDAVEKGIDLLVESLATFAKQNPYAQIIVVGLTSDRLEAVAASAGVRLPESLKVLERMQEIEQVYWATDVLLLTSRREGSPNVVHEARACGVAIVSTDCGDVRDTMLPRDRVVAADPSQLVVAILEVLAAGYQMQAAPQAMSPIDCATLWAHEIDSMLAGCQTNFNEIANTLPKP